MSSTKSGFGRMASVRERVNFAVWWIFDQLYFLPWTDEINIHFERLFWSYCSSTHHKNWWTHIYVQSIVITREIWNPGQLQPLPRYVSKRGNRSFVTDWRPIISSKPLIVKLVEKLCTTILNYHLDLVIFIFIKNITEEINRRKLWELSIWILLKHMIQ